MTSTVKLKIYYTVRHKKTQKFIDHNIKAYYRILTIFGTIILDTICYQTVI